MQQRVLGIDPGAIRCGFAILDPGPKYIKSGVIHTPRGESPFQEYRMHVQRIIWTRINSLIYAYQPGRIVTEIVPAKGGGNFSAATQDYLANCVATMIHACAFKYHLPLIQVSARSVQSKIAIRGNTKGITKVQIRNGVLQYFPELEPRKGVMLPDESDALAIALHTLLNLT